MLTLTQLFDLATSEGIDLFEGLTLPEGSPLDRDIIINSILMRCGLNYPNFADPNVMKSAITVWSSQNQYSFRHIAKIYEAEYSPIENYDRYEDLNSNKDRTLTDGTQNIGNKTENIANNISITEGRTSKHTGTDSTTDESKTSAYDSSTYQPESKSTSDLVHGETITDNGSTTNNSSANKSIYNSSNINKDVSENENTKQNNHIRGNIGVMTATTMQKEEYELLGKFNPYDFIAELFENSLTLFVY